MKKSLHLTIFAFSSTIAYIIVGISHFLMPPEQLHFAHGVTAQFFISLAENQTAFHFHYWAFAIGSLLTIGVIANISFEGFQSKIADYVKVLVYIGLSVTAFDFARMHSSAMRIASKFTFVANPVKESILINGLDRLDSYGISFNLMGIFLFYLNVQWFRSSDFPKWVTIVGMLCGVILQFVLIGTLTHVGFMIDIAAGVGGIILFPLWLIGLGIQNLKEK